MKSMQQMQEEMLSRCFKNDGWPKPVVHFGGVLEICRDQEHLDRALAQVNKEMAILAVCAALSFVALIAFLAYELMHG